MENTTPTEQAPAPSLEDRAASLFSDEQPKQQEAAPQQETAPETFELEVEGERFLLPKKLEKGFLQEKDYTQKTQELAERRKDFERRFSEVELEKKQIAFAQSVKQQSDQLAVIDAVLAEYDKLPWGTMPTDELLRKRVEVEQYTKMREGLKTELDGRKAQFEHEYQQELDRVRNESKETLRKRLNWTDETEKEVRDTVTALGFTDAEYETAHDPRLKQLLWEATQYRKAKDGAKPAVQQVKSVKTNSSNPMPQAVKDKFAFQKSVKAAHGLPQNSPERRQAAMDLAKKLFI